jgi:hypothetical protein
VGCKIRAHARPVRSVGGPGLVKYVPDVCVIHNRHKGILQDMNDIEEGSEECHRAAQWPDVHSRWCIKPIGANFHSQFRNKELIELLKRLCE